MLPRRAAHALCGAAGNLSAIGLQHAAKSLEEHIQSERLDQVAPTLATLGTELDQLLSTIDHLLNDWKQN